MFEPAQVEGVIRHLLRFGSSPADAEDLAQEALVIAWRKEGERDTDRSLDAWLYGIARNVYRNHTRTIRRRAEQPMEKCESKERVAGEAELLESVAVRDALQTLPENQQDIVILHELEQYTLKETASLLAIPFDTAKDRLRRARAVLREHLHVDIAQAATGERRTTSRLAKAAVPVVLAGVLSSLPRSALAVGSAGAAVRAGASAAGVSKLIVAGTLALGLAIGAVAHHWASPNPSPTSTGASALAPQSARASSQAADVGGGERTATAAKVEPAATDALLTTDAGLDKGKGKTAATSAVRVSPEAHLVERARVAMHQGRWDDAIRELMAHERRFLSGQLAEERDVLLVEAYLAAGNLRLASLRLRHYRSSHPTGFHQARADEAARELERRGALQ